MGKMKTKSAAAKRFKRSGSGKLMHESPGRNHLAMTKNAKRQRRLHVLKRVNDGERGDIETLVPYK